MMARGLSGAVLLYALLGSVLILSAAALRDADDALRNGSFCPNPEVRTHELDHRAPELLGHLWRCAEVAVSRQLTEFERAILVVSGVPASAL